MINNTNEKPTVALFSPGSNVASETFIRAHRDYINARVVFYTGGHLPTWVNDMPLSRFKYQFMYYVEKKVNKKLDLTFDEFVLMKSLKEAKPDLVLCEFGPTANASLRVISRLRLPLLVYFHGYDMSVRNVIQQNNQYKEVINYASKLFVVSRDMEKKIIDFGAKPEQVIYNPCAPNDEFLKIKHSDKPSQSFMAAGRFTDKKAPYLSILAFKEVLERHPKAKLTIAGDGELYQVCRDLVKYFKLEQNVDLPGSFDIRQLKEWLKNSVAFVQHSVTAETGDQEGTPVVIGEAMAAGLPIISTKHAGIKDIVETNKSGFLVEEYDVDGMAKMMISILDNPQKAKSYGEAGRAFIEKNLTMSLHINKIDQAIHEITDSKTKLS